MASFSQTIEGKYGVVTYQETKNTYDWIMKSIGKGGFEKLKVATTFQFDISEISCSCESLEEFVSCAYGQNDYSFIAMTFNVYSGDKSLCYISVSYSSKVRISTDTKYLLENIVGLLKDTSLNEVEVDDSISVAYIEHQSNDVIINGDSNTVATNSSTAVNIELPTNAEPKWKQNFRAIMQNLAANWLWYLLCLGAGALLSWAVSQGFING